MSGRTLDVEGGERTLFPADQATRDALTEWDDDRVVVRLEVPELTDSEEWERTTDLLTGTAVAVRRADCGAGCRCAAEVKLSAAPEVSYAPCIQGTIEIGDRKSEFLLPLANDSVKYSQWGADNTVLWPRADLLEVMADAAAEWVSENLCRTCHENLLDDGEGYDGECGDCADKTDQEGESDD